MNTLRKYVSDLLGIETVKEFIKGNNYLIGSEMGSGKNYWVRNILLPYAYDNNMKVLILTSRVAIKEQQYNYLEEYKRFCIRNFKGSTFEILSYQKFESILRSKEENDYNLLNEYDYVVCDEAHYFAKDTSMNPKTVLSFNWLNNNDNIIKIFMTATYESLDYLPFRNKLKGLKHADYTKNNVKDFYRYENEGTILPIVQSELDKDKKVLIVNNKINDLDKWQDVILGKVEKLISTNKDKSEEFKNIVEKQKFNSDILNTTSLICEGAEIFDNKVETIVINGIFDLEKFVQTTARIRSNKVNVYYKKITQRMIAAKLKNIEKQLFYHDEFLRLGEIEFVKKYGLDIIEKSMKSLYLDIIISPITREEIITLRTHITNLARLEYEFDLYNDIKTYGFENRVLDKYFPNIIWYDLEEIAKVNSLKVNIIDRYKGKKLFKEDQKNFINILVNEYGVRTSNGGKDLGSKTINAFFEKNHLNYILGKDKETKGEFRNKNYWVLQEVI